MAHWVWLDEYTQELQGLSFLDNLMLCLPVLRNRVFHKAGSPNFDIQPAVAVDNRWIVVVLGESADYGYGGEVFTSWEAEYALGPFLSEEEANACWRARDSSPYEKDFVVELRKAE